MSLYQHQLFTIDLNKIIAVYPNEDETLVTIRTDDQRKIEVESSTPEATSEFLDEIAGQWEEAVGPVLRHAKHVFLAAAIYSIQVEGDEVYIYFRDHSVSFAKGSAEGAQSLLAELTESWQAAVQRRAV